MGRWAIHLVLCLLLFSSNGLELDIVENGDTKPMPSVVQTKPGATFSLVCKSEVCRSKCTSLTWRRRKKESRSSWEVVSSYNWLNFTNAALDDQGFYGCVDTMDKTGKVMYLVVQKPGFEKESIGIIKKDLGLTRRKRDYSIDGEMTYDSDHDYDVYDYDWDKYVKDLQDEIDSMNQRTYAFNDDRNYHFDNSHNHNDNNFDNTYATYNSKKTSIIGLIFWGIAGVILTFTLIHVLTRCCHKNTDTSNRGPTSNTRTNRQDAIRPPPSPICSHRVCEQCRIRNPRFPCLYSNLNPATRNVPASIFPLLQVPRGQSRRDELPTHLESTENSATNLNEARQNGTRHDAVDTCSLPSYDQAVYNIAVGLLRGGDSGGEVNRELTSNTRTNHQDAVRSPPSPICSHTVCEQCRIHYPRFACLYSNFSPATRNAPASTSSLPQVPSRDELPTYLESTENSTTNLNEARQHGTRHDAVDTCLLPSYEQALYNIAAGLLREGDSGGDGGNSGRGGGDSDGERGDSGRGGCDSGGGGGDSGGGGGDSGDGGDDSGGRGHGGD